MSDKKKEETEISPLNINLPKPNETIKLIGNKRERYLMNYILQIVMK